MKKIVFLIFFSSFSFLSLSQKVYSVEYVVSRRESFVSDYESRVDLCVYKVDYSSQSGKNDGNWYFVEYVSQQIKKYILLNTLVSFDILIHFVDYKSQ